LVGTRFHPKQGARNMQKKTRKPAMQRRSGNVAESCTPAVRLKKTHLAHDWEAGIGGESCRGDCERAIAGQRTPDKGGDCGKKWIQPKSGVIRPRKQGRCKKTDCRRGSREARAGPCIRTKTEKGVPRRPLGYREPLAASDAQYATVDRDRGA